MAHRWEVRAPGAGERGSDRHGHRVQCRLDCLGGAVAPKPIQVLSTQGWPSWKGLSSPRCNRPRCLGGTDHISKLWILEASLCPCVVRCLGSQERGEVTPGSPGREVRGGRWLK